MMSSRPNLATAASISRCRSEIWLTSACTDCLVSQRNDLLFKFLRSLRMRNVIDNDVCTLIGGSTQQPCLYLAYTAVSACDDGNFAFNDM